MDSLAETAFPDMTISSDRSLSSEQWETLRPYITRLYRTHTASMVLKELGTRRIFTTDKILRTRFKKWGIDNKNKRKTNGASLIKNPRSSEVANSYAEITVHSPNTESMAFTTTTPHCEIDDYLQSLSKEASSPLNTSQLQLSGIRSWTLQPFLALSLIQPSTSDDLLRMEKLFGAMGDWYDHLVVLESRLSAQPTKEERSAQRVLLEPIYTQLASGLHLIKHDVNKGWRVLQQVENKASASLHCSDPAILTVLFDNVFIWRDEGQQHEEFMPCISVVFTLLMRTSRMDLGEQHPLTLAISAIIRECMSSELSNKLFKAIKVKYSRRQGHEKLAAFETNISQMFDRILGDQRGHIDVEKWCNGSSGDRTTSYPTPTADAHAFVILAESRRRHGQYLEAATALSKAWICLDRDDLRRSKTACSILKRFAWLMERMNKMAACETSLLQYLDAAPIADVEADEINTVTYALWHAYVKQGKLNEATHLRMSNPGIIPPQFKTTPGIIPPRFKTTRELLQLSKEKKITHLL